MLTTRTSERTRCSCQIIICISRRIMFKTRTCCKMLSTAPHYCRHALCPNQMNIQNAFFIFLSLSLAHTQTLLAPPTPTPSRSGLKEPEEEREKSCRRKERDKNTLRSKRASDLSNFRDGEGRMAAFLIASFIDTEQVMDFGNDVIWHQAKHVFERKNTMKCSLFGVRCSMCVHASIRCVCRQQRQHSVIYKYTREGVVSALTDDRLVVYFIFVRWFAGSLARWLLVCRPCH